MTTTITLMIIALARFTLANTDPVVIAVDEHTHKRVAAENNVQRCLLGHGDQKQRCVCTSVCRCMCTVSKKEGVSRQSMGKRVWCVSRCGTQRRSTTSCLLT